MRKLLIILYWGREGSSAIIKGLSCSDEVYVPVFEEFDKYLFIEKFKELDLLSTMLNIEEQQELYLNFKTIKKNTLKDTDTICFKWRPWGSDDILDQLALKYDLHVVLLSRKYAYNHALRHLISELIYKQLPPSLQKILSKDLHIQFLKSHARYSELLSAINSIKVDLPLLDLKKQTKKYCHSRKEIFNKYINNKNNFKTKVIFFEDYIDNVERTHDELADFIGIQKYHPDINQGRSDIDVSKLVNNYQELISNPELLEINENYLNYLKGC